MYETCLMKNKFADLDGSNSLVMEKDSNRNEMIPPIILDDFKSQLEHNKQSTSVIDQIDRSIIRQQRRVKKEHQKLEQKQKQEEKKKIRDMQAQKLRFTPKFQSVTLVTSSFKEKLTAPTAQSNIGACCLDYSSDFPALDSKPVKAPNKKMDSSNANNILEEPNEMDRSKEEVCNRGSTTSCGIRYNQRNSKLYEPIALRKYPRTTDNITFDLAAAIELSKMKKLESKCNNKKRMRSVKRKERPTPYSANILDSDQPQLHRGKIRLDQKKKVTSIKAVVLERRKIWKKKKNEWKSAFESCQRIKLTDDMIKDFMVLKLCDLRLKKDKEICGTVVPFDYSGEKDNCSSNNDEVDTDSFEALPNDIHGLVNTGGDIECHESVDSYTEENSNFLENQVLIPKRMIHSKRFATYCDQWPSKDMTDAVNDLLKTLVHFQQKTQACDPFKADLKRRFYIGLTEVTKYLKLGKIVMVIFATDIEEIDGKGGLLDVINNIKRMTSLQKVPYVFANTRQKLKGILKKNVRISCVGIRNYEGADKAFKTILQLMPETKKLYREKLQEAEIICGIKSEDVEIDPNVSVIQSLLSKLISSTEKEQINQLEDNKDDSCPFLSAIIKHEKP